MSACPERKITTYTAVRDEDAAGKSPASFWSYKSSFGSGLKKINKYIHTYINKHTLTFI